MLPFLKQKQAPIAGLIIKSRTPDIIPKSDEEEDSDPSAAAIEDCAKDLLKAIEMKDHKALADILADVFAILDKAPQDEDNSNVEPHSYDAQNIIAAKGNT